MKTMPIILLALMLVPASVMGQEELPDPGITPDSIFYGLDMAYEKVQLVLARDEIAKARLRLELANERIAEGKSMAEKGKPEYLPELVGKYEENLDKAQKMAEAAKRRGKDTTDVEERVALATSVHVDVLERVLEKVPEQAKPAIERAINCSARGQEKALNRLGEVAPERSADILLRIAENRLNKARVRAEAGDPEEAKNLVEEYNREVNRSLKMLEKAKAMRRNVTEVQERVLAATSTHQEVLREVYKRVPAEAKEAIETAMNVSKRGHEEALEALNISLPPQAERAKAGKQRDGDRERVIHEVLTGPHETVPAQDTREEKGERVPETPVETEPPVTTPEPSPEMTEIPETLEAPETPTGHGGMP